MIIFLIVCLVNFDPFFEFKRNTIVCVRKYLFQQVRSRFPNEIFPIFHSDSCNSVLVLAQTCELHEYGVSVRCTHLGMCSPEALKI